MFHFAKDLLKVAGFVATAGLDGVAVHRVAAPEHLFACTLDRTNQLRQMIAHLVGSHACDQIEAARVVVRVERVDQSQQVIGVHARPDLDPDRVMDPAQKLDMRAVQLARTVTDPQHVGRAIVVIVGQAVAAHEGLFVIEQQRFVGSEETGFAQLRRAVHAASAHKGQGFINAGGQLAVLFSQGRVGDEVQIPFVDLMQVGKTALGKSA